MKISILGTNGFLSTAIAKYANEAKWQLDMYGLDLPVGHAYDNYYRVNLMDGELDCSSLVDSQIIVYAIGAGIQANLNEGFNLIFSLNVTVPVTICNKLKELGFQGHFVTFGSVFEMGETKEERFFTEEDIITSICPAPNDYTVSKRMLTRFISSYKHDFTHWHFIIPTIYGAGENPKRLIPYTINAIQSKEPLHFTAGNQTRQYLHVSEVSSLIFLAYEHHLPSGIYNIEGPETLTVREIVTFIHKYFNKEIPTDCFGTTERADVGMNYLALDGTVLLEKINFRPSLYLKSTIQSYLI